MKKLKKKRAPKNNSAKLLFVGLGNPGDKYRETRHNAGFAVIDYISREFCIPLKKAFLRPVLVGTFFHNSTEIILIKPLTFMNRSGDILEYIMRKYSAGSSSLVLICDNMDLKPGIVRLKAKGSSAGHNGIKSVIENLGSSDFVRMYIGVGRSECGETIVEHVLGSFQHDDKIMFDKSVQDAAAALIALTEKPLSLVMNETNKKNN